MSIAGSRSVQRRGRFSCPMLHPGMSHSHARTCIVAKVPSPDIQGIYPTPK